MQSRIKGEEEVSTNSRLNPMLLIPILFLILALSIPVIFLRDPNPMYPPIPDYFSSVEYYLFRNYSLAGNSIGMTYPLVALVGITLLQMFVKPKMKWQYDLALNLVISVSIIVLWSSLVYLIFIAPSNWIPTWFPTTPILGLEFVLAYRILAHHWTSNRQGTGNIRSCVSTVPSREVTLRGFFRGSTSFLGLLFSAHEIMIL